MIISFAQSIKSVVRNAHFFIFNPKGLTDKGYHYKFAKDEVDPNKVHFKLLPDKTEASYPLYSIQPIQDFLHEISSSILP